MATQLQTARTETITNEVKVVAKAENVEAELVRAELAAGRLVIPANKLHIETSLRPAGIGRILTTKVNANIGTSSARSTVKEEIEKMQTALAAIHEYIPEDKASWTEPTGGYLIWFKLRAIDIDESSLLQTTEKYGATVSPGRYYFYKSKNSNYFRISISTLNEEEIIEGIKRLAKAIKEIYQFLDE